MIMAKGIYFNDFEDKEFDFHCVVDAETYVEAITILENNLRNIDRVELQQCYDLQKGIMWMDEKYYEEFIKNDYSFCEEEDNEIT